MYKNGNEVLVALKQRYDGPTYTRKGAGGMDLTYIPWTENVDNLDAVFGVFGWSFDGPIQVTFAEGHLTASLAITVRVLDPDDSSIIEKTVSGVGSAVARDENSAKSASSKALSKAVALFGDKFGRYLSEKGAAKAQTNYSANVEKTYTPTNSNEKMISDAQKRLLGNYKVTPDQMNNLTMRQASNLIKALKEEKKPLAQALASVGIKAVAPTPQASSDGFEELDDLFSDN